jgi:hypothetical protein
MKKEKLISTVAPLIMICALTVAVSGQPAPPQSQEVIGQARNAYYNLRKQGFSGFKAAIEPNWEVTLGPAATKENLKIFQALRFAMAVDANGAVTVTHEVADTEKLKVGPYVRQIHDNVQRLVASFFGMWAGFMVRSPFPEHETQIRVENSGGERRLSYTAESVDVVLTMTNDLLITEWKRTGPGARRIINPLFQKTDEGLLLNSYKSLFEPVGEGIKTTLEFTIEYQDVSGMKLPHKIEIRGVHGNEPIAAELTFNQFVLNPR